MSKELLPWEAEEIDLSNVSATKCFLVDGKLMTGDELKDLIAEDDEDDFLSGVTCNPDAPEECESCQ